MENEVHFRCIPQERDLTVKIRSAAFTPSPPRKPLLYKELL